MIVHADLNGVAGASPVHGFVAGPQLGHRSDVHHARLPRFGLGQHGPDDMFGRRQIHPPRRFGTIVRRRRHHPADVKHIIRPRHAIQHILIARQIAPYNAYFPFIGSELFAVDLTGTRQHDYIEMIKAFRQFDKACASHRARRPREKYRFFALFHLFSLHLLEMAPTARLGTGLHLLHA